MTRHLLPAQRKDRPHAPPPHSRDRPGPAAARRRRTCTGWTWASCPSGTGRRFSTAKRNRTSHLHLCGRRIRRRNGATGLDRPRCRSVSHAPRETRDQSCPYLLAYQGLCNEGCGCPVMRRGRSLRRLAGAEQRHIGGLLARPRSSPDFLPQQPARPIPWPPQKAHPATLITRLPPAW
jgi:hypothetical protein